MSASVSAASKIIARPYIKLVGDSRSPGKPAALFLSVALCASPKTNNASPNRTNKYTLFHITPAINSIINGYVLNMANETPESKLRNPSYEKKICERLMSARISALDEKNVDLMNPQSTKIADIAT